MVCRTDLDTSFVIEHTLCVYTKQNIVLVGRAIALDYAMSITLVDVTEYFDRHSSGGDYKAWDSFTRPHLFVRGSDIARVVLLQ